MEKNKEKTGNHLKRNHTKIENSLSHNLLIRNSAFNLLYNILNLLFPLVTAMYVSRILYPEGMGKVAYAQNLTSYFITFATLGLSTYGVREIAKARSEEYSKNKIFTELFLINWISTSIAVAGFLVFVFAPDMGEARNLMLCCGIQLLFNFINIDWLYQGMEEYAYIVCRSIIIKALSVICIFIFVREKADYIVYALITSIALAGNYLFNIIHARKFVKFEFYALNLKRHIKPLIILGIAVSLSTIYSKLDITMLGWMHSERETGLYSNAFRLVGIAGSIGTSVSAVFLPRLSYYYENNKKDFLNLIQYGIAVISFFAFPIAAGLIILAPSAVEILFGDSFIDAVSTVRILAALVLIKGFGDLLCYQLSIATGHEKDRLVAYAMAAILNICLNAMLIPTLGRNGAAIASVCSELLLNTVQYYKMKKIVGYTVPVRSVLQGIFTTCIMVVAIFTVISIPMGTLLQMICGVIVGICAYFIMNYALHNDLLCDIIQRKRTV